LKGVAKLSGGSVCMCNIENYRKQRVRVREKERERERERERRKYPDKKSHIYKILK